MEIVSMGSTDRLVGHPMGASINRLPYQMPEIPICDVSPDVAAKADALKTTVEGTGAVRSADAEAFDYASAPILGIMGVARTASEGAAKYGRYNYMKGFPVWKLVNRAIHHCFRYLCGDRSEPHLSHAAWNLLVAETEATIRPDQQLPHMLGPGMTMTPELLAHLAKVEPDLAAFRKSDEAKRLGDWKLRDLPDVAQILKDREFVFQATASAS